jgi:hypothetical protein
MQHIFLNIKIYIMKTKLLFTLLFSIGMVAFANAQVSQEARIHEGVRSGELTRPEAARLQHGRRETRRDIRRAKADGHITRSERREIRHDRRKNNREIFRLKHNRRERRF